MTRRPLYVAVVAVVAVWVDLQFVLRGWDSKMLTLGLAGETTLVVFSLLVAVLATVPFTSKYISRLMETIDGLLAKSSTRASVAVALAAAVYFVVTVKGQHRPLYPYIHDESSYLIQAHQFATGRLWRAAHPQADFFDSFQLFVRPVYASAYFPGTALARVPGIWLHVPDWLWSIAIAAAVCGLLCRVLIELLGGTKAMIGVLLLITDDMFREQATLTVGQPPLLLYGLSAVAVWLHWCNTESRRWLIVVGFALGLAAVTRPVDALCFAIPIGIAVAGRAPRLAFGRLALVVAGSLPLLLLQLTLDKGITGQWTRTPFNQYADADYPGTAYGFHRFDPAARPSSPLPQKQDLYRVDYRPLVEHHRWSNVLSDLFVRQGERSPSRVLLTVLQASPLVFPLLVPLLPLCLFRLTRPRAVVVAGLPLFLILYVPYAFFFPGYTSAVAPAVFVAILSGAEAAEVGPPRMRRAVRVGLALWITGLAVASLPQFDPDRTDAIFENETLAAAEADLAKLPGPSIVFFTYDPGRDTNAEPVYNAGVSWPDDAKVIRAHDLGPRNGDLLRYYSTRSPVRTVYRFDEKTTELNRIGTVGVP